MKNRPLIVACAALALSAPSAWSRDFTSAARGTTTANFLKLGVGARAIGMGEAFSAVADDATALYWNPAGLTRVDHYAATLMHAPYLADSYFDYAAYAHNLGEYGAIGGGLQYFSAGRIEQTDLTGTGVGDFSPYDVAASLGYAYDFGGNSLGVTGKFIKSKIIDSASTAAADIGFLSEPWFSEKLRLAVTAANIGANMKFDEESERLPLALRLGSSYKLSDHWVTALDLGFPVDNNPYVALGTDYRWLAAAGWPVSLRAGYNSLTTGDVDGFAGFSFGFGVEHRGIGVDYAAQPFGSLGLTHRISLNIKFSTSDDNSALKTSRLPPSPESILQ